MHVALSYLDFLGKQSLSFHGTCLLSDNLLTNELSSLILFCKGARKFENVVCDKLLALAQCSNEDNDRKQFTVNVRSYFPRK